MKSMERALTEGISQITKAEVFYIVNQIDKIQLPESAQNDFYLKIGEDLKVKNSLLEFRQAYKLYYLGYVQGANDKTSI